MRVILGADDLSSQIGIIRQSQVFLSKLNGQYHTNFRHWSVNPDF